MTDGPLCTRSRQRGTRENRPRGDLSNSIDKQDGEKLWLAFGGGVLVCRFGGYSTPARVVVFTLPLIVRINEGLLRRGQSRPLGAAAAKFIRKW